MKKFSWIFALILALSMAFIGCPADDGDDNGVGDGDGVGGDSGDILFGSSKTVIKKEGTNAGTPINPGTLEYLPDGSGYHYVYGQGGNTADSDWNYGNSILRFKIDLGDKILDDYGYVTFDWQADGPYKTDVNSSKSLFLAASANEEDLTPYKGDGVGGIADSFISTTWYDDNPGDKLWNDTTSPKVNGIAKVTIQLPILKMGMVGGEVWFAIYVHSSGGGYTISNFKLGGDPDYVNPPPGTAAPDEPVVVGPGAKPFDILVDLSDWKDQGGALNGNENCTVVPNDGEDDENGGFVEGSLTIPFTLERQRVNIKIDEDQIAAIENRSKQDVTIEIVASISSGTANLRYSIGDKVDNGGWNAFGTMPTITGSNSSVFTYKAQTTFGPNALLEGRLNYFIIQTMDGNAATIVIESIRIYTTPFEVTLSSGDVTGHGVDVTYITNGYNAVNTVAYDAAWAYFNVVFPEDAKLSDYSFIEYKIKGITSIVGGSDVTGNKPIYIYAYAAETDIPTSGNNVADNQIATGSDSVGGFQTLDTVYTRKIPITVDDAIDLNDVWIVIRSHGSAGLTYEISDIKFY